MTTEQAMKRVVKAETELRLAQEESRRAEYQAKADTIKGSVITKDVDFEETVRSGYYRKQRDLEYYETKGNLPRTASDTFQEDFRVWLSGQGIPRRYVEKVAQYAYEQGHSSGEEEILNVAYGLVEIFK